MQDFLPRIYREASLPYTVNKSLLESSKDSYYLEYSNKPISEEELLKVLKKYNKRIHEVSVFRPGNGSTLSIGFMYPTSYKDSWLTSEFYGVDRKEEIHVIEPGEGSFPEYMAETYAKQNGIYYDIKFCYKVYKKRKSLINIEPLYAINKTRDYFNLLVSLAENETELYLILSVQCDAIEKYYEKMTTQTTDFSPLIQGMMVVIEKWFQKRVYLLNKAI